MDKDRLYTREFEPGDACVILSWIQTPQQQRMWSADRYSTYPPRPEEMIEMYAASSSAGGFYPFCLTDGERVIGHFILRYPTADRSLLRIGFVIVDPALRGQGLGKILIGKAEEEAGKLGAEKVSLGVFSDNAPAYGCYASCGFEVTGEEEYTVDGTCWGGYEMRKDL